MIGTLANPEAGAERGSIARWEALGSSVVLRVTEPAALGDARHEVERELAAIDRACSRFRADSELVRLNARAGWPTQVSPLLFEALLAALRAAELSEGDVDPTLGSALELAGYDRDWRLLEPVPQDAWEAPAQQDSRAPVPPPAGWERMSAAPQPMPAAPQRVTVRMLSGWRTVELEQRTRSVRVPRGIALDLGASAKAWAADRSARAAAEATGCGVLVGLGGDIATGGEAPADGWRIHVTDDHRSDPSAPGQTVAIDSGGLATSSTAVRRWRHGGRTMHHILDPASGLPAREHWRTVSVAAGSCSDANIAATAAIVRCERAPAWLELEALPARLLDWNGTVINVAGWPA